MKEKPLTINHSIQKTFAIIELMTAVDDQMSLNDISKQTFQKQPHRGYSIL